MYKEETESENKFDLQSILVCREFGLEGLTK